MTEVEREILYDIFNPIQKVFKNINIEYLDPRPELFDNVSISFDIQLYVDCMMYVYSDFHNSDDIKYYVSTAYDKLTFKFVLMEYDLDYISSVISSVFKKYSYKKIKIKKIESRPEMIYINGNLY